MSPGSQHRSMQLFAGWLSTIALALTANVSIVPSAQGQDDVGKIFKAMSGYVASQKIISAAFDSDILTPCTRRQETSRVHKTGTDNRVVVGEYWPTGKPTSANSSLNMGES